MSPLSPLVPSFLLLTQRCLTPAPPRSSLAETRSSSAQLWAHCLLQPLPLSSPPRQLSKTITPPPTRLLPAFAAGAGRSPRQIKIQPPVSASKHHLPPSNVPLPLPTQFTNIHQGFPVCENAFWPSSFVVPRNHRGEGLVTAPFGAVVTSCRRSCILMIMNNDTLDGLWPSQYPLNFCSQ
jgi:hypothetical protein